MINLLSPDVKRDIKAARVNVILVQYCVAFVMLGVLVAGIYGAGFWLISRDEQGIRERLTAQEADTRKYTNVVKQADTFRSNLKIAKDILSKEISYSQFLTTLAKDIPSGTVLTKLTLGSTPGTKKTAASNTTIIDARATSYEKVLELKTRLEQSELLENVSISSATRPDNLTSLSPIEARYPYTASLTVTVSGVAQ